MDTQSKLVLNNILSTTAEQKASDLHLSVGSPPTLRMNGQLIPLKGEEIITKEFMEEFTEEILDEGQREQLQKEKELVFAYQHQKQARFRVNIFYQKKVLAAYLRLIGDRIIPLEQLGLPTALYDLAQLREGLLLISGVFGSGKTTTSASILEYINEHRSAYILTIERPIEYIFQNRKSIVEQREIGRDAISFEHALSSITQEDVNVLFLSEVTSPSVIKQALTIAASGRLVIANVEADTTMRTLELILNSFSSVEQGQIRQQLSLNLAATICQRLIPKIGGGQVAVAEIMRMIPPIQSNIREGSLHQINNIIQTSRAEGMVSLDWSLAELVKSNQILPEDALKHSNDPQQLQYMLQT
ncbi:MAG: PilT/PilU family type 4a pilus ATPase [Patescibacteria group bacterium]